MNLVKVISTSLGTQGKRIVKFLRNGTKDIQTSFESSPYGIDSNPVKDMIAIYAETGMKGDTVIVGYLNKNKLAEIGETRLFSTDSNGTLKTFVWLKNDGTIELGGSSNNVVKYTALNNGLQNEVTAINAELTKIATAITSLGGAYAMQPIQLDISASKSTTVKTL